MGGTAEPPPDNAGHPAASLGARLVVALIAAALVGWVAASGWIAAADRALADGRAALSSRSPTGEIVVVGIDPPSLRRIGVWPWPRRVHAELLDRLRRAGVARIAYDVDFSARSNEADDAALVAAAARLGPERLALPALRQVTPSGEIVETLPFPRLRAVTARATVTVRLDADGVVRRMPAGARLSTGWVPSLPVWLTGIVPPAPVRIDASLPVARLAHLSAVDVLAGRVDPAALAGKLVLVGATDLTLGDRASVPGGPGLAGVQVQALAAEFLLQGRIAPILQLGAGPLAATAALLGLLLATGGSGLRARTLLAGWVTAGALIELVALVLERHGLAEWRTVGPQLAIALPVLGMVLHRWSGLQRLSRGLSRRVRAERALNHRLLDLVPDGLVTVGADGRVAALNPAAVALLGPTGPRPELEALFGDAAARIRAGLGGSGAARFELDYRAADGTLRPAEALVTATPDAAGIAGLVLFHDISERRERARELVEQARTDALTGLANRTALLTRLEELERAGAGHALVLIDLVGFREINDTLGLDAGDRLLRAVARRLEAQARGEGLIARLGADHFLWSIRDGESADPPATRAMPCIAALAEPFVLDGSQLVLSARAGLVLAPEDGSDPTTLLRRAGVAVDEARRLAVPLARFDPRLEQDVERRLRLRTRLPRALAQGAVAIWMQPQVDALSGRLVGAEALARWDDPELGRVPADEFVPLAELSGAIGALTDRALEEALRAQALLAAQGIAIDVSVNVSTRLLDDPDLPRRLGQRLAAERRAGRVVLEITEGAVAGPPERLGAVLDSLRAAGFELALDDFGSGYSSLGRIARLPLDEIKLDRSLLPRALTDLAAIRVVEQAIALGRQLGRRVVAEGVEDRATAAWLAAAGCDRLQGWLWGPAMPVDRLLAWAAAGGAATATGARPAPAGTLPNPVATD